MGYFQILRLADAQGLDAADPGKPFPQLLTILRGFLAMQLDSREAHRFHPGGDGAGILIQEDPHLFHVVGQGSHPTSHFREGQIAGCIGHRDEPKGTHPQRGDGLRLILTGDAADFDKQPAHWEHHQNNWLLVLGWF
jgi:hypothetical protein